MKTNLGANHMIRSRKNSICQVCGKDFCSIKALHGHMRSHPDRSWRGIQPPMTTTTPPPSPVPASLPRWSVTARRGRKSASASAPATSASTVSDDRVVVNSLMFLSKSDHDHTSSIETARELQRGLDCEMGDRNRKRKISKTRVKQFKEIEDQLRTLSDSVLSEYQIQLKDSTSTPTIKKLYRCDSCNKEFSSHQALGGHKSSHNKLNKTSPMIQPLTIFDSTQTVRMNKRRMLDFDLNELPPMDDDDYGEAAI